MKKFILIVCLGFAFQSTYAQFDPFAIDDFEDGTTQGWINGGTSPNPPTNIPTGGPLGADDNFIEEVSSGVGMQGSRWVMFNNEPRWLGNYTEQQVISIRFEAKNAGNTDLNLRVAMQGTGTRIATTEAFVLPTTQTDWVLVDIPILEEDFTLISGGASIADVLLNVQEIRIVSSVAPDFIGDQIDAVGHIDNIQGMPILSVNDLNKDTVSLYPNPVTNLLTIDTQIPLQSIEVFNILGSQILKVPANGTKNQVDLSSFDAGFYFIQINSENSQKTFRIVKN